MENLTLNWYAIYTRSRHEQKVYEQIHALQTLTKNNMAITPCQYLKEGERVRVINGPLIGTEGILIRMKPNKNRLVLSVDLIKKSVSLELDELDVEPILL